MNQLSVPISFHHLCDEMRDKRWENVNEIICNTVNFNMIRTVRFQSTIMHHACRYQAPLYIIDMLYQIFPQALQIGDEFNSLPLHHACSQGGKNPSMIDVIQYIIAKYPNAVRCSTNGCLNRLPLHIACQNSASASIIEILVQSWPDSVKEKFGQFGRLPIHIACDNGADLPVIELLTKLFPESLTIQETITGFTPLHTACYCSSDLSVIQFLAKRSPESLLVQDYCYKKTPLQLARDPLIRKPGFNKNGKWLEAFFIFKALPSLIIVDICSIDNILNTTKTRNNK